MDMSRRSHLNTGMYWMMEDGLVNLNQDLCSDSPTRMVPLAGSGLETEGGGGHLNIKIDAALLVIMPTDTFL